MSDRVLTQNLRRRQLDRLFTTLSCLHSLERPRRGWIVEIRNALGMSAAQLAARLGVRQSSVAKMEQTEQEDTISLQTLRRAAEAMDCTLVYAFLPRQSLETFLEQQALQRAKQIVGHVEHSMTLEAQARNAEEVASEVQELAAELIRTLSRELWREEKQA